MPSTFNANDAAAYERVMGRWSRRLAPHFLDFAGAIGGKVLEVGCGTGSLTFLMAERVDGLGSVEAIDIAPSYIGFAQEKSQDARLSFSCGDASNLDFADDQFDHAVSLLALHLMTDPESAMRDMVRVTRDGGSISGAVWDVQGGFAHARMFLDTAAMFDPAAIPVRERYMRVPLCGPGELAALWQSLGLVDVEQSSVTVRFEYSDFADYWQPFTTGEGTMGGYVASLAPDARAQLSEHVRQAYLSGMPDGPRSFAATAWVCRGTVHKPSST